MTKNEAITLLGQVCQQSRMTWQEHQLLQEALTLVSKLEAPKVEEAAK